MNLHFRPERRAFDIELCGATPDGHAEYFDAEGISLGVLPLSEPTPEKARLARVAPDGYRALNGYGCTPPPLWR
jgi:hypothetical protein